MSTRIRCSALPRAMLCPPSALGDGLRVDPVNDAAPAGTAAHECLRAVVAVGSPDWDRVGEVADEHGADRDEVRMLVACGAKLWQAVRAEYPHAVTEAPLSAEIVPGLTLTGHADVLSNAGTLGRGLDWKTGRKDSSYREQMLGYAALQLLDDTSLTESRFTCAWVREQEIEHYTLRREDLQRWIARVAERILEWDGVTYSPGAHCQYCPRAHGCEAATALVRRDVGALAGAEGPLDLSTLAPTQIVSLVEVAKRVGALSERVVAAAKAHIQATGDVVANGVRLAVVTESRREVDPLVAWPVLEAAGFADEDLAAAMSLSVTKIEKRAAEKAGRGHGAKAVRALNEQLEAAGAITRREVAILRTRREETAE